MHWEETAVGIAWLLVAVGAYTCARLTRRDRNYYPMQRVIWTALGFLGMGAGVRSLFHYPNTIGNRFALALVLLLAIGYSIRFMHRRNTTPRYIALDISGAAVKLDEEHLRQQSQNVTSLIQHGAAPESWVRGMEEACAEWHRLDRWRTTLQADADARKARKEGR